MSFKRKGSRRSTFVPGKMDTAKAQSLLGFTSNRWMDASTGTDPKILLDQALDAQMQKATQRKAMKSAKEKVRFGAMAIQQTVIWCECYKTFSFVTDDKA
jgi:hypothetical protein